MPAPRSISVVMCVYNPKGHIIARTIAALASQTIRPEAFELVIVDNGSMPRIAIDLRDFRGRIVVEPKLGLTNARLRGVKETTGDIIVFVDDDNVLEPNYLQIVQDLFGSDMNLGAIGGRVHPLWEADAKAPPWIEQFMDLLALRDLGDEAISAVSTKPSSFPQCAPVGAGMGVRRSALTGWIDGVLSGQSVLDRKGDALTSGGDNDIVLHVLSTGFSVAYNPRLTLGHIIPASRLDINYLGRLCEGIMESWVVVLAHHGIRPWTPMRPLSFWPRVLRSYFVNSAWRSPVNYLNWRKSVGLFRGRISLFDLDSRQHGSLQ